MDKKKNNMLKMLKTTAIVLRENELKWKTSAVLSKSVPSFFALIDEAKQAAIDSNVTLSGVKKNKDSIRVRINEHFTSVSSALLSIANYEGNIEMAQTVKHSASRLARVKDQELISIVNTVLGIATDNMSKLADYNLTEEDVNKLKELIDEYSNIHTLPRNQLINRKMANQKLEDVIYEAKNLLNNQIDLQMKVLGRSEPQFLAAYTSAREIIDL